MMKMMNPHSLVSRFISSSAVHERNILGTTIEPLLVMVSHTHSQ